MTRPIRPAAPFNAVVAPSKSRKQIPYAQVLADVRQSRRLMGDSGVAGYTEIARRGSKTQIVTVFGPNRVGLKRSDCPITWTPNWRKVAGGVDRGAPGVPVVAPARKTAWAQLEDGLNLGVISAHMHPGAFAARPSRAQRLARPLLRRLWWRHWRRIQKRIDLLIAAGCDLIVVMGDINHPGLITPPGVTRVTGPGLLYLGVTERGVEAIGEVTLHRQHADHPAAVVTITPKEHR
jgi:hypothetical protein